jgi:hypothetical protein
LGIFRDHARILHGGCSAVLNEAAAIRTFLLNSWRSSFWLWMDYYLLCLGGQLYMEPVVTETGTQY